MTARPPSSAGGLKSIKTVSVTPSYVVVGGAGDEETVAATIENSDDNEPVPIELRAETLNL